MTSSRHGPHALGRTRPTVAGTKGLSETARRREPPKTGPGADRSLQPDCVKPESLVTAGQDTAVNTFPGAVHSANPFLQAGGGQEAPRIACLRVASTGANGASARRSGWGMVAVPEGAADTTKMLPGALGHPAATTLTTAYRQRSAGMRKCRHHANRGRAVDALAPEPMKDAAGCDKPREAACRL